MAGRVPVVGPRRGGWRADWACGYAQQVPRRLLLPSQRLTWLAGLALVACGILCLCLSAAVARPGSWWQGTLGAFGVGFTVGGVVDVLAIFGLSRVVTAEDQRRQENNKRAEAFLRSVNLGLWEAGDDRERWAYAGEAMDLLFSSGILLDRQLHDQLVGLVFPDRRQPDPLAAARDVLKAARQAQEFGRQDGGDEPEAREAAEQSSGDPAAVCYG
jgi:hypothetical protein